MAGRYAVRFTANFLANLDEIRAFLEFQDAEPAFSALLAELFGTLIPNLRRFPRMGRDFLAVAPASIEGQARRHLLRQRSGRREVREYVSGDYLVLYAIADKSVFLLAIRHHLQLSFDLRGHWG